MALAQTTDRLGSYILGERLGVGGMAEVFAAESAEHGQVALKRILPSLANERDFADMFWDEARITSRLDHPNVIRVLDYGRIDGQLFMALEYVDGPSVARVLRKAARAKSALDSAVVLSIGEQLLSGLDFVHHAQDDRGTPLAIVHRDVSPGNILLSTSGQVKLGDFGIVRSDIVLRRTQPGELKGKIGYMSPEQVHGRGLDGRSDVFSVGVVLAELLILRPLLLGKSEMQTLNRTAKVDLTTWHRFNEAVPISVRSLVEKALRRDPDQRFQSALEMRQAILDVAQISGFELGKAPVRNALTSLSLVEEASSRLKGHSGEQPMQGRVLPASGEYARTRPLGPVPRADGRPLWKMSFDERSLPRQLFMALRRTRDGLVQLSTPGGELSLELRAGRLIASHAQDSIPPLGELLVRASLIDRAELGDVMANGKKEGLRLGEQLVLDKRVRESAVRRALDVQTNARLAAFLKKDRGSLAVYLTADAGSQPPSHPAQTQSDGVQRTSVQQLVEVLRGALDSEALTMQLGSILGSVLIPVPGTNPDELGLTAPEARALQAVSAGGACEGRTVSEVLETLTSERIARQRESAFAILIGLSAGVLQAPGF